MIKVPSQIMTSYDSIKFILASHWRNNLWRDFNQFWLNLLATVAVFFHRNRPIAGLYMDVLLFSCLGNLITFPYKLKIKCWWHGKLKVFWEKNCIFSRERDNYYLRNFEDYSSYINKQIVHCSMLRLTISLSKSYPN